MGIPVSINTVKLSAMDLVVFDQAPGPIFFLDSNLRILKVNPCAIKTLGYSEEELLKLRLPDIKGFSEDWSKILCPKSPQNNEDHLHEVLSERKNGEVLWLSVKICRVDLEEQSMLILYCRDISEQKKAARIILENAAQMQVATEIAKVGYWEYEYPKGTLKLTDQFFSIFKTSVEEAGGYEMTLDRYSELFLPPGESGMIERERKLGYQSPASEYHRYLEHRALYATGEPAWMGVHFVMLKNENGEGFKTVGVTQDITERKRTELMLEETEITLEKAFHIASIGACSFDFQQDVMKWTERALNVLGLSSEEAPACLLDFFAIIHPEDLRSIQKMMKRLLSSKTVDIELRLMISGQLKWVRFRARLEFDQFGLPLESIGIIQDINRQKLADQELADYRERLEKLVSQRTLQLEEINKDLEAFAYSISHDLRAPIRHINGFTTMLIKHLQPEPGAVKNYLDLIISASRRMGEMIDALLNFSRLGRQELIRTEVNLNDLVRDVVRNFAPDVRQRSIDWQIEPLPTVSGDQQLLKIVFENLISNALKYTHQNDHTLITIGSREDNSGKVLFVRDNGVGFDMAYSDKLFGVFQRLHNEEQFDGTGIGLANVHQILKKHGWKIRGEGDEKRGATFYIHL